MDIAVQIVVTEEDKIQYIKQPNQQDHAPSQLHHINRKI